MDKLDYSKIKEILADEAELLDHKCEKITSDQLYKPSAKQVDEIFANSNRSQQVQNNLSRIYSHGRLANTGYLSILPVDQGIEHSAAFSFDANPMYFDPENIVKLAIEGGCNAVASTFGALGLVSGKYADQIPFIVKINHNELLSYPNAHRQTMFGLVEDAAGMGAAAIGATIYFGSQTSRQELEEVSLAFSIAHELGLATVLWCYVRNEAFQKDGVNYETAADLTGQANHLGVTIQADIIKQKLPTVMSSKAAVQGGSSAYGKYSDGMYDKLLSDHPIDMARFQVLNCYAGKIPLISSGGGSGDNDLQEAVSTAVINKRAGGAGLIMGRKAFRKPFADGVSLLNAVQDVYACEEVTLA